jgi:hypothetical protein
MLRQALSTQPSNPDPQVRFKTCEKNVLHTAISIDTGMELWYKFHRTVGSCPA